MKSKHLLVAFMALFPWMTSCAAFDDGRLKVPFSIPFHNLHQAGAKISADFVISKYPSFWTALLGPRPADPKQLPVWNMYLDFNHKKGDKVDWERVAKFAGGSVYEGDITKNNGKWIDYPGVPITLKIIIVSLENPSKIIVYNKEVRVEKLFGSLTRVIDWISLAPGTYHIDVENINQIPELADESVSVDFTIAYPSGK